MDELVKLLQEKVGLNEDQARQAVKTVVDFLKEKLPDPIATQLEAALSGDKGLKGAADALKSGAENVGGFLSKAKQ
ncbi:MAG: DUF2267 domain-containing protein [Anaerolineae bacterium]